MRAETGTYLGVAGVKFIILMLAFLISYRTRRSIFSPSTVGGWIR